MLFNERLIELRTSLGMKKKEVAEKINMEQSTYGKYELGKRQPSLEVLQKISEFFDVSTDYLLGNTDEPAPPGEKLMVPEETKNMYFAFHRGEFEDLTQDEVDALALIARKFKANRKGE